MVIVLPGCQVLVTDYLSSCPISGITELSGPCYCIAWSSCPIFGCTVPDIVLLGCTVLDIVLLGCTVINIVLLTR